MRDNLAGAERELFYFRYTNARTVAEQALSSCEITDAQRALAHMILAEIEQASGRYVCAQWHQVHYQQFADNLRKLQVEPSQPEEVFILAREQQKEIDQYVTNEMISEHHHDELLDALLTWSNDRKHMLTESQRLNIALGTALSRVRHDHPPEDARELAVQALPVEGDSSALMVHATDLQFASHMGDEDIANATWERWTAAAPMDPALTVRALVAVFSGEYVLPTPILMGAYFQMHDAYDMLVEQANEHDIPILKYQRSRLSLSALSIISARLEGESQIMMSEVEMSDWVSEDEFETVTSQVNQKLDLAYPIVADVVSQYVSLVRTELWDQFDRSTQVDIISSLIDVAEHLGVHKKDREDQVDVPAETDAVYGNLVRVAQVTQSTPLVRSLEAFGWSTTV